MDSKSENGLSCGLVALDLETQEHIPSETSALQNFKKMAEHLRVWTLLDGGSLLLTRASDAEDTSLGIKGHLRGPAREI